MRLMVASANFGVFAVSVDFVLIAQPDAFNFLINFAAVATAVVAFAAKTNKVFTCDEMAGRK